MDYIKQTMDGKQLVCKNIKESDGKVTLCLSYCDQERVASQIPRHFAEQNGKPKPVSSGMEKSSSHIKKKKSPSRIKRDRARFRNWLAKKQERLKSRKQADTVSIAETESSLESQLSGSSIHSPSSPELSSSSPELPPPSSPELSPSSPELSPSRSPHKPVSADILKEVEEVLLAPSADDFFGPYQKDCYETCNCSPCSPSFDISTEASQFVRDIFRCDACLIPADQAAEGLKRCMRCKCVAYCSKSCQVAHWKQQHKPVCDKMREAAEHATIAKARAHLVQRELRISHQSLIHRRAAYKSGIMERLTLISPFLGVICPT